MQEEIEEKDEEKEKEMSEEEEKKVKIISDRICNKIWGSEKFN